MSLALLYLLVYSCRDSESFCLVFKNDFIVSIIMDILYLDSWKFKECSLIAINNLIGPFYIFESKYLLPAILFCIARLHFSHRKAYALNIFWLYLSILLIALSSKDLYSNSNWLFSLMTIVWSVALLIFKIGIHLLEFWTVNVCCVSAILLRLSNVLLM